MVRRFTSTPQTSTEVAAGRSLTSYFPKCESTTSMVHDKSACSLHMTCTHVSSGRVWFSGIATAGVRLCSITWQLRMPSCCGQYASMDCVDGNLACIESSAAEVDCCTAITTGSTSNASHTPNCGAGEGLGDCRMGIGDLQSKSVEVHNLHAAILCIDATCKEHQALCRTMATGQ